MAINREVILSDLLHITQDDGFLYTNNERAVITSTSAFSTLQHDLIENIGIERLQTFFFKFGYHLGEEDAKKVAANEALSMVEKIARGPVIHSLKGYAKSEITETDLETQGNKTISLCCKGMWQHSFEAEQYVKKFGFSERPVCHSLSGYASGFVSFLLGEKVFFKELQCEGQGAPCCKWEGRLVSDWQEESKEYFSYSKELPVLKELEQTNEQLLHEKNNLSIVTRIHQDLTDELIKGSTLATIVKKVNEQIHLPIIVEDKRRQLLASSGIALEDYHLIKSHFDEFLKSGQTIMKTRLLHCGNGTRLVAPIFLLGKIVGYCSFLYDGEEAMNQDIDSMLIGKLASVCSLTFLKEKIELDSMERAKSYFFEEIISGKYASKQEIIRKADYFQLDLADRYYVINMKYKFAKKCEEKELTIHKNIYESVSDFFNRKSINILIDQETDSLFLLITEKQLNNQNIVKLARSLVSCVKKEIKHALFLVGISSLNSDIMEANVALNEARAAVRLSSRDKCITNFSELGMIGVLINEKNEKAIRKIIKDTLGILYEDLDSNKITLMETLYHFLVNGGNLEQTADDLALSVSGLRYRLNKITELLGHDLRDPQLQFQLLLALKAVRIIDYELIVNQVER
ncbi:V4R domain-containing protein [Alteribacillus persepolensis]|uniref:V4R domain-containing protein n=1 Tax=Alteribacillus persepolensis TaxID=568899 RepID=A0A1G8EHV1_9BACI|nr:XylR N-terminal domain-containing protein [Alteribacillus persepolensis]SDH69505.1 V4R domain-containing protein [Alteribacillus persepolensis]